jgi:3-(3-hydroxy-phenyl)propionate hydroxylase
VHGFMRLMNVIPRLRSLFEDLEIKPLNRFQTGCFVPPGKGARLRRGQQMPQVWLKPHAGGEVRLSDDVLGQGLAMVGFGVDPSSALSPQESQDWIAAGGQFVQIDPCGHMARVSSLQRWEDLTGTLMPSLVPVGWVAIVRPDKVVMHDGPLSQASVLLRQATAQLGSVNRRRQPAADAASALQPGPAA